MEKLTQQVADTLQDGDLIFISINAFLYKQVARGTGSWTSHIGFVLKENDEWMVYESKVPRVKRTPLRDYLSRTCNNEVAVLRLDKPLTPPEKHRLREAAHKRIGAFYHLGFRYESKRQFCSKFVHDCFKEAVGVEVGQVKTLKQLLAENPQANVNFWRYWYFGFIPWQRRTITPADQLRDPGLVKVFATANIH